MIPLTKMMAKVPKRKTSNLRLDKRTWLPATTLKPQMAGLAKALLTACLSAGFWILALQRELCATSGTFSRELSGSKKFGNPV